MNNNYTVIILKYVIKFKSNKKIKASIESHSSEFNSFDSILLQSTRNTEGSTGANGNFHDFKDIKVMWFLLISRFKNLKISKIIAVLRLFWDFLQQYESYCMIIFSIGNTYNNLVLLFDWTNLLVPYFSGGYSW